MSYENNWEAEPQQTRNISLLPRNGKCQIATERTEGFLPFVGRMMKHEMKIPDQAYGLELLTNVLLFD